jgi:hypothetical protein
MSIAVPGGAIANLAKQRGSARGARVVQTVVITLFSARWLHELRVLPAGGTPAYPIPAMTPLGRAHGAQRGAGRVLAKIAVVEIAAVVALLALVLVVNGHAVLQHRRGAHHGAARKTSLRCFLGHAIA